jgi:DNA-binding NarL/FixJ family response regulator
VLHVIRPCACRGGFRDLSASHLLNTGKQARLADCRLSVRRIGSGSEGTRTETGLDSPGHRTPRLNGIDAARRIRKVSPGSKILFLSQESSGDVIQEALSMGAMGYVVKAQVGSDLLEAVEAVILGKAFVAQW